MNFGVDIEWLPDSAKSEASAAIEDGEYTTSGDLLLAEVIDVENAFLLDSRGVLEPDYYKVHVTETGDETRLELEEEVPETRAPRLVAPPETPTDTESITLDVHIKYVTTNEVLFDETVELEKGDSTRLNGDRDYRWGDYHAKITTEVDGEEFTQEENWSVNNQVTQQTIRVQIEGFGGSDEGDWRIRYGDGTSVCEWDSNGELIHGRRE